MNARLKVSRDGPVTDDQAAVREALRDLIIQLARQRARADHAASIQARNE